MKKVRRDAERDCTGHKNKQVERDGTRHGETRITKNGTGQDGTRRGKERKETRHGSEPGAKRDGTGHKNEQVQLNAERGGTGYGRGRNK